MRNFVKNLALAALFVVMVLPQAPISLRYLLFLVALCACFTRKELNYKTLKWQTLLTAYAIILGACYFLFLEDGTLGLVMAPSRDLVIAALAVFALRGRSPATFLSFGSLWTIIQLGALIDEHLQGALWARLPFPIAQAQGMEMLSVSQEARDTLHRFGAFTYESSIVGGMAGFFAVVALLMLTFPGGWQKSGWKRSSTVMAWFSIGGAIAINALAETKSGLFTFAGFLIPYILGLGLTRSLFKLHVLKKIVMLTGGVALAGVLVWHFSRSDELDKYIEDEVDHVSALLHSGLMDNNQEGGVATRWAYLSLAFQALPYHPFGVGSSGGYAYVQPVLDRAATTAEMDNYFSNGNYLMTTPFTLIIMYAGIFGLLLGWMMVREGSRIMCPHVSKQFKVWGVAGLFSYLIFISSVGLSPYLAMFIFLIEGAGSCNQNIGTFPRGCAVSARDQLGRLVSGPKATRVASESPGP